MITLCHLTRPLAGTNTANMVCCPVRFLFYFLFFFCIAWVLALACYYLLRILLRLITIKAGLTLSSLSFWNVCWSRLSISDHGIHTYRQTDTDSSMIPTFIWRRLLLPLIYCWSCLCFVITLILRTGWLVGWLPGVILLLYNTLNYRQSILWTNNGLGFPLSDRSYTTFVLAVLASLSNIVAGFGHEGSLFRYHLVVVVSWNGLVTWDIDGLPFIPMPSATTSYSCLCQKLSGMKKRGREGIWLAMLGFWFCLVTLFSPKRWQYPAHSAWFDIIFYGLHTFHILYITITWVKLVPISVLNWSSRSSAYSQKVPKFAPIWAPRIIEQILLKVIFWKRIIITLKNASGYYHGFLLGLFLWQANSTLVLFSGDSFNRHITASAAATIVWIHKKYIYFPVSYNSSNMDGDVTTLALALIEDWDAPLIILILRFETSTELRKVGIADSKIPWYCGRFLHSVYGNVYVICDLLLHMSMEIPGW